MTMTIKDDAIDTTVMLSGQASSGEAECNLLDILDMFPDLILLCRDLP